jgi:probable rRNA maturation factor
MISQQIKTNSFALDLLDTSNSNPWTKKAKMKRYLKACLPVFEEFLLGSSGLGYKKEGITDIEMTLTLCGEKKIRSLNRDYRNKDKKTDVLSFPVHEELRQPKGQILMGVLNLGDVFICKEVAVSQAKEFGIDVEGETVHLLVHGFLHVLGYDHEISAKEEKIMQDLENKLLKKISNRLKR